MGTVASGELHWKCDENIAKALSERLGKLLERFVDPVKLLPVVRECMHVGCFALNKKPRIELFAPAFQGGNRFGDADGIIERNYHCLLLEWKSGSMRTPGG